MTMTWILYLLFQKCLSLLSQAPYQSVLLMKAQPHSKAIQ